MTKSNTVVSVADVLEREVEPTIKEWLRRVNLVPELTHIPLSDKDRTGHLPKLYFDLIARLRLAKDAQPPVSIAAAEHGQLRRARATPPPCSLRSRECSRSPRSAHYISIRANSIRTRCF